jgi:hypothetical protein
MFRENVRHGFSAARKGLGGATLVAVMVLAMMLAPARAQERGSRTRIDVQKYVVNADLDPRLHRLHAQTEIEFVPQEDGMSVTFELNNNLTPSRVVDGKGQVLVSQRFQQESALRVSYDRPLSKGQAEKIVMEYDGTLASGENQPVEGLKLAYVGEEVSYLLYPGRWIPVSGYRTDRFSAQLNVTVPQGLRVVGPGPANSKPATEGQVTYGFNFDRTSFPASLAVVSEQPQHVTTGGFPVDVYFRGSEQAQAQAYGEAAGKIISFFTGKFGPLPIASLSLVEIDSDSLNGYSAPATVFLSPRGIGSKLNYRLLSHELSHQWWRASVSPATSADLWLDEGLATYSEMLYVEELAGKAGLEQVAHEVGIAALANDTVPIARSASLEEFSPQYDSVVAKKGAMVLQMLRWVIGDEPFFTGLRTFAASFAGRSATTDDLRQVLEEVSAQNLQGFFTQWMDSTGAPEFKADYTVYRTQKGFKIVGKIKQDMDTFRMPVELRIDTDGEPEIKRVEVVGTASDFTVETFGRPRKVTVDPENHVLKLSDTVRLQVAISRGQQFADAGEYDQAIQQYQKALDINKNSSLAHFRLGEVFFAQNNWQSAANAFRESLNGDGDPKWTEVWSHINLGKIYDVTGQRERAVNEYNQAIRTRDDTQGAQSEAQKYIKDPYKRERNPVDGE